MTTREAEPVNVAQSPARTKATVLVPSVEDRQQQGGEGPTVAQITGQILRLGMPLNVSQIAQLSIVLVTMSFAGRFGPAALGGAAVATGLMNATGYAFGAGLCGALETLLSHAYGRRHSPTHSLFIYGTQTQRMILLQLITAIPLGFVVANLPTLLVWMGQPPEVVHYTQQYTQISLWGLVPFMLLEVNRRYFAAQHLSTALIVSILIAAVVNPLLQYQLTQSIGFQGAPLSWTILMVGLNVGLVLYLYVSRKYTTTWGGWSRHALQRWKPMLLLAAPSLGMTLCEWAALELNTMCAGFAPPLDLAAFAITVQMLITMWTMPSGVYIAMSVLIGNSIGEGRPLLARRFALCGIAVVFAIALLDIAVVLALGRRIAEAFTDDPEVIQRFMSLRWLAILFHIGDTFQSNMLGILRGVGYQKYGALGVGGAFGVVGVPLGLSLFLTGLVDVKALWIGPLVGVYGFGAPFYWYMMLRRIPWHDLRPHDEEVPPEVLEEELQEEEGVIEMDGGDRAK